MFSRSPFHQMLSSFCLPPMFLWECRRAVEYGELVGAVDRIRSPKLTLQVMVWRPRRWSGLPAAPGMAKVRTKTLDCGAPAHLYEVLPPLRPMPSAIIPIHLHTQLSAWGWDEAWIFCPNQADCLVKRKHPICLVFQVYRSDALPMGQLQTTEMCCLRILEAEVQDRPVVVGCFPLGSAMRICSMPRSQLPEAAIFTRPPPLCVFLSSALPARLMSKLPHL